jgi:hypothetical protein
VGEIERVAEAQEHVVVVPHLLEVPKVPVEVVIRVGVQVGNPMVAREMRKSAMCDIPPIFTGDSTRHPLYFIPSLK